MVVITIVALLSGAVVLAFPRQHGGPREAVTRLAAVLVAARDTAIIDGRDTRLRADANGYGLEQRRRGRWEDVSGRAGRRTVWPDSVHATAPTDFTFDSTGGTQPAALVLQGGQDRASVAIDAQDNVHVAR